MAFLPELAQANQVMAEKIQQGNDEYNMERLAEGEDHIEMVCFLRAPPHS
jgi:uncharacterized membrane-anchored protein